jgi:hypothetical protein
MSNLELVLNMLAEATTIEISKKRNRKTLKKIGLLPNKGIQLREIPVKKLR